MLNWRVKKEERKPDFLSTSSVRAITKNKRAWIKFQLNLKNETVQILQKNLQIIVFYSVWECYIVRILESRLSNLVYNVRFNQNIIFPQNEPARNWARSVDIQINIKFSKNRNHAMDLRFFKNLSKSINNVC